ncbi:hypothetical protein [Proteus phage RP7]|nr:hypothetical protein [Proteus phage RP7]
MRKIAAIRSGFQPVQQGFEFPRPHQFYLKNQLPNS